MYILIFLLICLSGCSNSPLDNIDWQHTQCDGLAHTYCKNACEKKIIDSTLKDSAICFRCVDSEHDLCMKLGWRKYFEKEKAILERNK